MNVMDTNLMLAIRCANCGKISFHNISMFKLPANNELNFCCDCGKEEITITLKNNKFIILDVPCLACDINHSYKYKLRDVFKRRLTVVCCNETGLELCFLGKRDDVIDTVSKYQENLNTLLGELGLSNH